MIKSKKKKKIKYTHTYKNKLGNDVKCYIVNVIIHTLPYLKNNRTEKDYVIVVNQNGVGVYLPFSNLIEL